MATIIQHQAMAAQSSQEREYPLGDSSFLQRLKYNPATFQLTVTMKNGSEYTHFYVYPMVIDQMMQSPSKGKFYAENIKGKHPAMKVTHKNVGAPVRDARKGPVNHERKRVA